METKENNISVNLMISICNIIDEYNHFNNNLKKFMSEKYNFDDAINLWQVSLGRRIIGTKKTRGFYDENKNTIDKINENQAIYEFIIENRNKNNSFMRYVKENRENIDQIVTLLKSVKSMGFKNVILDFDNDFANSFFMYKDYDRNKTITYLDDVKVLSKNGEIVKYKSDKSNYMILSDDNSSKIILNNLLFDPNLLPDNISKESSYDSIINNKMYAKNNNKKLVYSGI